MIGGWLHVLALVTYFCMLLGPNTFCRLPTIRTILSIKTCYISNDRGLASCVSPSHILLYAPRAILAGRLVTTQII